jgi:hypothetical protein
MCQHDCQCNCHSKSMTLLVRGQQNAERENVQTIVDFIHYTGIKRLCYEV